MEKYFSTHVSMQSMEEQVLYPWMLLLPNTENLSSTHHRGGIFLYPCLGVTPQCLQSLLTDLTLLGRWRVIVVVLGVSIFHQKSISPLLPNTVYICFRYNHYRFTYVQSKQNSSSEEAHCRCFSCCCWIISMNRVKRRPLAQQSIGTKLTNQQCKCSI